MARLQAPRPPSPWWQQTCEPRRRRSRGASIRWSGADRFVFRAGHGVDEVRDYVDGVDRIKLVGADGFGAIDIAQSGEDVVISHGAARIILRTEDADALDIGDFIF